MTLLFLASAQIALNGKKSSSKTAARLPCLSCLPLPTTCTGSRGLRRLLPGSPEVRRCTPVTPLLQTLSWSGTGSGIPEDSPRLC